jgi:hypothetical protein
MIEHPKELVWIDGPLPDANAVPETCIILGWILPFHADISGQNIFYIKTITPRAYHYFTKARLADPKWRIDMFIPLDRFGEVVHWAWIRRS